MDLQRFFDPFSPIPDTVLPEVIVDSKPKEQEAKNENWEYNGQYYNSKTDLYFSILLDQAAEQFGIKDILAFGAVLSGQPFLKTRGKFQGATNGTSLASKYLSKIPGKSPIPLPTITGTNLSNLRVMFTKNIGRFLGRSIPILGWGVLAYDIGMTFYNAQVEYNRIVGNE